MTGKLFTEAEIILCTYAALYDAGDFGGEDRIHQQTERSLDSIKMKIRNIAALLDKKGVPRSSRYGGLTGRTTGEKARSTNWDTVEPLTRQTRDELLRHCQRLVAPPSS